MKKLVILFASIYFIHIAKSALLPSIFEEFLSFKKIFKKNYKSIIEEIVARLKFVERLMIIRDINSRFLKEEVTYNLKINKFADLSDEELDVFRNGNRPEPMNLQDLIVRKKDDYQLTSDMVVTGPASKDWRTEGKVTPVKDQGFTCGSCWAFSSIGALESALSIKYGNLTPLSEQFLIDCNKNDLTGNWGCSGGSPGAAYLGIEYAPGVPPQSVYPYEEKQNACRFNYQTSVGTTKGYVKITSRNETFIRDIVGTIGPVTASVNSKTDSFMFYGSGVLDDPDCVAGTSHSVVIVGYGTARYKTGKVLDYWICKNSWSTDWGENGYFRIARGKDMCGIARTINLPLV